MIDSDINMTAEKGSIITFLPLQIDAITIVTVNMQPE